MNSLGHLLWQKLFDGDMPPDLISLNLPSLEERRRLIDDVRGSIVDREALVQRLEAATGTVNVTPEVPWICSPA